jgi:1-acyl-sn-glycerol-3-phosphate acyltransferase
MSRLLSSGPVRTVLSVWSWFALGLAHVIIVPLVAVVWLITWRDPGKYHAGLLFRKLAVIHQKLNPLWTFTISGDMPTDPRRPYVVVANHESFVDILLVAHLPFEMKWMSKSDFFKFPFTGWGMRMAGDIRLDRGDKSSNAQVIEDSLDRLRNRNVSVMIFAEGTRSKTGALQPFKDGAFRIAIQAGAPILPLAIVGTRDALVKHDWRFGEVHAEVRVLPPIPTDGLTKDDVAALRERTRDMIAAALTELRAEHGLPEPVDDGAEEAADNAAAGGPPDGTGATAGW